MMIKSLAIFGALLAHQANAMNLVCEDTAPFGPPQFKDAVNSGCFECVNKFKDGDDVYVEINALPCKGSSISNICCIGTGNDGTAGYSVYQDTTPNAGYSECAISRGDPGLSSAPSDTCGKAGENKCETVETFYLKVEAGVDYAYIQWKDGQILDAVGVRNEAQCKGNDDQKSCNLQVPINTGACKDIPDGPVVGGDPHIKSLTGDMYYYHGECDLKLIHAPKFDGQQDLDIDARTTIQFNMYSFIETAAVRIGEDILEVSSWGEYALNGVEDAVAASSQLPELREGATVSKLGGYPIYHTHVSKEKHIFDIILSKHSNITVSNFKRFVNVKINHETELFSDVSGLMGDIHGNMFARDGVTDLSQDMLSFGQEWQVRDDEPMLFREVRDPQYPTKCILPDMREKEARRLSEGITEEAAKLACAEYSGASFAACVYDVTATNDLDQADSGSY